MSSWTGWRTTRSISRGEEDEEEGEFAEEEDEVVVEVEERLDVEEEGEGEEKNRLLRRERACSRSSARMRSQAPPLVDLNCSFRLSFMFSACARGEVREVDVDDEGEIEEATVGQVSDEQTRRIQINLISDKRQCRLYDEWRLTDILVLLC